MGRGTGWGWLKDSWSWAAAIILAIAFVPLLSPTGKRPKKGLAAAKQGWPYPENHRKLCFHFIAGPHTIPAPHPSSIATSSINQLLGALWIPTYTLGAGAEVHCPCFLGTDQRHGLSHGPLHLLPQLPFPTSTRASCLSFPYLLSSR